MLKKKIFFPVLALAIIGTSLATTNYVSAQDTTGPNSLVAAIAAKFNLNQTDVQAVFDEQRTKHEEEMKTQMEAKLTQAVTDGKITEAQKQAIIAHFAEMKNERSSSSSNRPNKVEMQNMTEEQRRAKMDARKVQEDAWLSQNGLTREILQGITGGPKGFGKGMMRH